MTQLVASVSQLVQIVGLNVQDLAALPDMGAILAMSQELGGIMGQIQVIYGQVNARYAGWMQLCSPGQRPTTDAQRWSWYMQASQWGLAGSLEAQQALSTVGSAATLLQAMLRIVQHIQILRGTTSGLQTVSALISVTSTQMEQLKAVVAPFQQALLSKEMIQQVLMLSGPDAVADRMRHWGRMP